jgi:hypothetical protein
MYFPHPSEQLQLAFAARPYQGAAPESAAFLFVGLDANYAEGIANHRIFPALLDYLSNGVEFWRRTGTHHPFLLPGYGNLDGAKYHRAFASIGFRPEHAPLVSFVELIHLPTYGRSKLVPGDLKLSHLDWLNRIITAGMARHVFVPDGVARLARASGAFAWMPKVPHSDGGALSIWYRAARTTVYCHYHLSVYGHQERKKQEQLGEIRRLAGLT